MQAMPLLHTRSNLIPILAAISLAPGAWGQNITEIIDFDGDGAGNTISFPQDIAVDAMECVYVVGNFSNNAFRITPAGQITQIIDASGDGQGRTLLGPSAVDVDSAGNVFIAGGGSENIFKITPAGVITEIIDTTGDGVHALLCPMDLALSASGNVYTAAHTTNNVFEITPAGVITEIMDTTGDGLGNDFRAGFGVVVGPSGDVYVIGKDSDNAFRITPGGSITEIIDKSGDGLGNTLDRPTGIAVDGFENVYVASWDSTFTSGRVFKITPGGTITQIIGPSGDGAGHGLSHPWRLDADDAGNVLLTDSANSQAFWVTAGGTITVVIDAAGDGSGNSLSAPIGAAVSDSGRMYVSAGSNNAFRISPCSAEVFCDTNPDNSATISVDTCDCLADSVIVGLENGPPGQFAYLLVGAGSGVILDPPGAQGELCLGGQAIGRYRKDIGKIDTGGFFATDVLNAVSGSGGGGIPTLGGNLCVPSGQSWNFQYWHRDGAGSSRFSTALSMTFFD